MPEFNITFVKEISATKEEVWEVITDTSSYPQWNKFVVACESTLEVGTPIVMKVRVLPSFPMKQKETVFAHHPGKLLEYGINIPLGLLSSSRKHVLTTIDATHTRYESIFVLKGLLAPIVKLLLGKNLQRGFSDMTNGIVERAQDIHSNS